MKKLKAQQDNEQKNFKVHFHEALIIAPLQYDLALDIPSLVEVKSYNLYSSNLIPSDFNPYIFQPPIFA